VVKNRSGVGTNNSLYDQDGDLWWDDNQPLSVLRTGLSPVRLAYFQQVLAQLGIDPIGKQVLDVGCGGGLLAEPLARLGCRVTGIDPSEPSLVTARAHATDGGFHIAYVRGTGEHLPFDAASFDVVCCCDVLEHVQDVDRVVTEIARVLKDGGVFFFDTINRTIASRMVMITLAQDWPLTHIAPPGLHDWRLFIRPTELRAILAQHGLRPGGMVGFTPGGGLRTLLYLVASLIQLKCGAITYGEFGRRLQLTTGRSLAISYAGYARKWQKVER
jgi:2-polyprenyl-6-hydroxyphenyl methylase/3-demethylubiquinone-9 3-methyltransferase